MTLDLSAIQNEIEGAFATGIGGQIAIAYQNVGFVYPGSSTVTQKPPSNSPWLRLQLNFGQDTQTEFTEDPVYRQPGAIAATIYVPKETGIRVLNQHARTVRGIMAGLHTGAINGVSCGRPRGPEIRPTNDGAWYQGQVLSIFRVFYC